MSRIQAQLGRVPEWFEYHGALAQTAEGSVPPFGDPDHLCYVKRVPIGVCGLVTPWNHPLLIAVKKISVCLAAGNTCVVKPSEVHDVTMHARDPLTEPLHWHPARTGRSAGARPNYGAGRATARSIERRPR